MSMSMKYIEELAGRVSDLTDDQIREFLQNLTSREIHLIHKLTGEMIEEAQNARMIPFS